MNTPSAADLAASEPQCPIESITSENVYACYQCARCGSSCPYGLGPHDVMRLLQLGRLKQARQSPTARQCASCMSCAKVCPKGLNPMRVIRDVNTSNGTTRSKGLRSRIFANIHAISRIGSRLAPVSNWLARMPGSALINHHLLGIHKNRALPSYASTSFPEWFRRRRTESRAPRDTVVLFHDTFMDYNFPEIGIAATRLLEHGGYGVELADMGCCGRPMISKGSRDQAIRMLTENVHRLYEPARAGKWIVGCEPSCLLALRDDYIELAPSTEVRDKARIIAGRALLIDEFLEMTAAAEENDLRFRAPDPNAPTPLLLHSHCHHKALADPTCSHRLLEQAGYDVIPVRAHCCGMAGSYGAEREHFARSQQAFEEGVGLAMRNHPTAGIAVTGASCRIQITDLGTPAAGLCATNGAPRRPRHVVEWLSDAIATADDTGARPLRVDSAGSRNARSAIMST